MGERPKAFVTLNAGATITGEALREWLNPHLGKHERVVSVEIRQGLPKTMVGKLSRKELVAEERAKAISRSEEHTSELQSLMRISYAVFCLKKKKQTPQTQH